MKNARFWTGLVFFTGLPMSLVMGTVAVDPTPSTLVRGSVSYQGRPMTWGSLFFESQDRDRCNDMVATIDSSGHFVGRAEWPRGLVGQARFRIRIYPDPRAHGDGHADVQQGIIGTMGWDCSEVRIGPEPTRIDIDLKD